MEITPNTLLYIAIVSIGLGIVIGLFLLFFGRKRGKQKLGVIGLIISVISGAIGPLLPVIVLVIFVFLIVRKGPLDPTSEEPVQGDDEQDEGPANRCLARE